MANLNMGRVMFFDYVRDMIGNELSFESIQAQYAATLRSASEQSHCINKLIYNSAYIVQAIHFHQMQVNKVTILTSSSTTLLTSSKLRISTAGQNHKMFKTQ
jgi:hypothetical protein